MVCALFHAPVEQVSVRLLVQSPGDPAPPPPGVPSVPKARPQDDSCEGHTCPRRVPVSGPPPAHPRQARTGGPARARDSMRCYCYRVGGVGGLETKTGSHMACLLWIRLGFAGGGCCLWSLAFCTTALTLSAHRTVEMGRRQLGGRAYGRIPSSELHLPWTLPFANKMCLKRSPAPPALRRFQLSMSIRRRPLGS